MKHIVYTILIILPTLLKAQDCTDINREYDQFDEEVKINSSLNLPVQFYKHIKKGRAIYYMCLESRSPYLSTENKGAIILLENGTKINKPSIKIDTRYSSGDFVYSIFFQMTPQDIVTYRKNKIKGFKLYIFDEILDAEIQTRILDAINCVVAKK